MEGIDFDWEGLCFMFGVEADCVIIGDLLSIFNGEAVGNGTVIGLDTVFPSSFGGL